VRRSSDMGRWGRRWRAGVGDEFMERADGYPGLGRAYGLEFKETRTMDLGLLYRALVENKVDIVAGNATDGLIEHLKLTGVTDDRHYFPPYEGAPVVRQAIFGRYPALAAALAQLGAKLSAGTMRRFNYAVDGDHREPADVVREFLSPAATRNRPTVPQGEYAVGAGRLEFGVAGGENLLAPAKRDPSQPTARVLPAA